MNGILRQTIDGERELELAPKRRAFSADEARQRITLSSPSKKREGRMKMRVVLKVLMLAVTVVLAGVYVYAGDLTVSIGQPFKAGGKDYPAGRYRILADADSDHYVDLVNLDTKTDDKIPFSTRLSERGGEWGEVVFDKVENDLYLAEIYIVGIDGFFFQGAPGKHKHLVVKEDILK